MHIAFTVNGLFLLFSSSMCIHVKNSLKQRFHLAAVLNNSLALPMMAAAGCCYFRFLPTRKLLWNLKISLYCIVCVFYVPFVVVVVFNPFFFININFWFVFCLLFLELPPFKLKQRVNFGPWIVKLFDAYCSSLHLKSEKCTKHCWTVCLCWRLYRWATDFFRILSFWLLVKIKIKNVFSIELRAHEFGWCSCHKTL